MKYKLKQTIHYLQGSGFSSATVLSRKCIENVHDDHISNKEQKELFIPWGKSRVVYSTCHGEVLEDEAFSTRKMLEENLEILEEKLKMKHYDEKGQIIKIPELKVQNEEYFINPPELKNQNEEEKIFRRHLICNKCKRIEWNLNFINHNCYTYPNKYIPPNIEWSKLIGDNCDGKLVFPSHILNKFIEKNKEIKINNQDDYVIVSKSDIDNLETARLVLCDLIEDNPHLIQNIIFNVSDKMWKITHRKYPNNEFNNCQKTKIEFIVREALFLRDKHGDKPAIDILRHISKYLDNQIVLNIIQDIGQDAINMMNEFFPQ